MTGRNYLVTFGFMTITLMALGLYAFARQPIRFNHQKHIDEVGLSCSDCHMYVETQTFAGLPDLDLCLTCHEEPLTENPEEEKLRSLQADGGQLYWERIYRVPDHVYFSHQRHVKAGTLECSTCHGAIAERNKPPTKPAIRISMERCMKCHEQNNVYNDCLSCHR